VDKGYVGHDAPRLMRAFCSGQKRSVHGQIRKELRRRSAIEPVIGHCKEDGHLGHNRLKGCNGKQINAVAVGYAFCLIFKWMKALLAEAVAAISRAIITLSALRADA